MENFSNRDTPRGMENMMKRETTTIEDCDEFTVDFESNSLGSPVGKRAFIQKLKELSKKHVSDMEGRSSETSKTEEETSASEVNDDIPFTEEDFQGCSLLPDFISTMREFDVRKYTSAFSSSLSLCSAKTLVPIAGVSHRVLKSKKLSKKPNKHEMHVRDRRKERQDRVTEFNCPNVELSDDFSISQLSGITMHTLQIQDFQAGLKAKKERRKKEGEKPEDNNKELQRIRNFLIAEAGRKEVYGNDMSFEVAVTTLHNLSKKLGVPVKDLLNDRGLRNYLRQKN